ncbi:MAG: hypothetical protein AB1598_00510 [Thermodesulfobacteriota bacterium]
MKKVIGLITLLAALPGLAGVYLLIKSGNLPPGALLIVVNAVVFRGVCGTVGGILLFAGRRWGSYLALVAWSYLIVVSILTLIGLHDKGLQLVSLLHGEVPASFGKPLFWSLAKLVLGIPVAYALMMDILRARRSLSSRTGA